MFNSYIKLSVKAILAKNNQSKMSMEECLRMNFPMHGLDISISVNESSVKAFTMKKDKNGTSTTKADTSSIGVDEHPILNNNQVEELKHQFLYINESQKVSDRMY